MVKKIVCELDNVCRILVESERPFDHRRHEVQARDVSPSSSFRHAFFRRHESGPRRHQRGDGRITGGVVPG